MFEGTYETGFENTTAVSGNARSWEASVINSDGVEWTLEADTLLGNDSRDHKTGTYAIRLTNNGYFQSNTLFASISKIEFNYGVSGFSNDVIGEVEVLVSADGSDWTSVGKVDEANNNVSFDVSVTGPLYVKFQLNSGGRVNIDDLVITE